MSVSGKRRLLIDLFESGLTACRPELALAPRLRLDRARNLIVLAVGKAAIPMARVVEQMAGGPISGLVVARHGESADAVRLPVAYASHPVPDQSSAAAGARLLEVAQTAGEGDDVIVLLSGGASALAALPGLGLSIEKKAALTEALLRSGATVEEINTVRRHLSLLKGGRLAAAAWPARVATYAISDVISDAPEAIGSGPTVADPTTIQDARAVLRKYSIAAPASGWSESVKPGDSRLAGSAFHIVASARMAHAAILDAARARGFGPISLGCDLEGEARDVGARHAEIARARAAGGTFALVSGGELTVAVSGRGRGGPNFEYAAALASGLRGAPGFFALAADSDGIDGNSAAAGAFVDGETAGLAERVGYGLPEALDRNDCATAFERIGAAFAPGPTGANVNDFRIILYDP